MAYSGLSQFVKRLELENEVIKITTPVSPELEITEITDRISKSNGKALLFTNNGTSFPLLINSYGSMKRMLLSVDLDSFEQAGGNIESIFNRITENSGSFFKKISLLPEMLSLGRIMPSRSRRRGSCQEIIHNDPDLSILPVLKCWPYDGGRFITLPMVHTFHPETGKTNVGMYRMQILDKKSTGMHWQRHKTGANHFEAWKKTGKRMPVTVTLGGDPVYAYSATAPLPENISEYMLAGFLRKKKIKMVKCFTNELYVPEDVDIVIEGYVDPTEELIWEGPFGDHTGFYSLADWYPKFHIECITHRRDAVYPATIVGIPPQEDAFLALATERIFLMPVKMTLQPEVIDFHLPQAGVAHNLMIVKIYKSYPGQGMKVLSSLFGTGQMMFTKYLAVVSGEVDIRNYNELIVNIFRNIDIRRDLLFSRGPLDVLDHASDSFSYGGKLGIDATEKMAEEKIAMKEEYSEVSIEKQSLESLKSEGLATAVNDLSDSMIPVAFIAVNQSEDKSITSKVISFISEQKLYENYSLFVAVDHTVDLTDPFIVSWLVLGNTDPVRDHVMINDASLFIDGTIKVFKKSGFPRKWPNVVCSELATEKLVDEKWSRYGLGPLIPSPSRKIRRLLFAGNDEIDVG